ncbi:hypothetical protein Patl1_12013 [Pistacia atlantica]|uniref:Uncharacterized protein n=1 Tax=Pistacia atlantica TaxID=434234 RepID=A0ACC1A5Y0_9ROSI|nr:hypothetical protein Patl1_12013 [Pistacia atlantica]
MQIHTAVLLHRSRAPNWIAGLTSLKYLNLGFVKLDIVPELIGCKHPGEFANLKLLEVLDLSNNLNLGGEIPSFLREEQEPPPEAYASNAEGVTISNADGATTSNTPDGVTVDITDEATASNPDGAIDITHEATASNLDGAIDIAYEVTASNPDGAIDIAYEVTASNPDGAIDIAYDATTSLPDGAVDIAYDGPASNPDGATGNEYEAPASYPDGATDVTYEGTTSNTDGATGIEYEASAGYPDGATTSNTDGATGIEHEAPASYPEWATDVTYESTTSNESEASAIYADGDSTSDTDEQLVLPTLNSLGIDNNNQEIKANPDGASTASDRDDELIPPLPTLSNPHFRKLSCKFFVLRFRKNIREIEVKHFTDLYRHALIAGRGEENLRTRENFHEIDMSEIHPLVESKRRIDLPNAVKLQEFGVRM